jgi:hypothetical protein
MGQAQVPPSHLPPCAVDARGAIGIEANGLSLDDSWNELLARVWYDGLLVLPDDRIREQPTELDTRG